MADEVTVSASVAFAKGSASVSMTKAATKFDVTGTRYTKIIQTIGTSEEALSLGDIATPGYCFILNLDATNYVAIRPATGVADLIRLKAGEFCMFRFDATAPFAIANTANVDIEILIIDD